MFGVPVYWHATFEVCYSTVFEQYHMQYYSNSQSTLSCPKWPFHWWFCQRLGLIMTWANNILYFTLFGDMVRHAKIELWHDSDAIQSNVAKLQSMFNCYFCPNSLVPNITVFWMPPKTIKHFNCIHVGCGQSKLSFNLPQDYYGWSNILMYCNCRAVVNCLQRIVCPSKLR